MMLMTRKLEGKMILETLNSTLTQLKSFEFNYLLVLSYNLQSESELFLEMVSILETEFRGSFKDLLKIEN